MVSSISTPTAKQIKHDILAYLLTRPSASDTVEGIVEWWLLQQEVQRQTATIMAALRELVQQGFVLETRKRDGRLHYRLNPAKRKEAQRVVAAGLSTEK
jgi:DNA-binding PadR family transcriptional regulator